MNWGLCWSSQTGAAAGRPKFSAKSREEAEDFFLDALSKWREEMGVEKMVLVGHSLGGYLAASYALRYPQHVEHLVLVCPAGMVRGPSKCAEGHCQSGMQGCSNTVCEKRCAGLQSQPPDPTKVPEWASSPWTWRGQFYRLGKTAWERGVTPGAIIRTLGPFGPKLIHGYSQNRSTDVQWNCVWEASFDLVSAPHERVQIMRESEACTIGSSKHRPATGMKVEACF